MISSALWLLAEGSVTTKFEFGRIQSNDDWWIYAGILLAILAPLVWIYRRDAGELPWYLRIGLPLLRTLVLIGLLVVYLQPRWRSQREEHVDSRVLMLVDTSGSMGLDTAGGKKGASRLQQVAAALDNTNFLARLRKKHNVTVVTFNSVLENDRRVVLPLEAGSEEQGAGSREQGAGSGEQGAGSGEQGARLPSPGSLPPAWSKQLVPGGTETRLGEALKQLLQEERSTPVSGVVLISDGGLNAGESPDAAEDLARESHIPIYTIGVGSEKKPVDIRLADFNVPSRVFPGDRFSVEGSIQGYGLKGQSVRVELWSREGAAATDPKNRGQGRVVDSVEKVLLGDGEAVPVKFELPPSELGHRVLCLHVKAPPGSSDASDKFLEGAVDVSDHQTHVLLLAGGPLRDYQYLRTLLFRDKSMKVDVLLQSGQPGMSQEASNILSEFPSSQLEMADYDCLVGFDPDWKALNPKQVEALYKWVDEDHGGMIVVAGPVYAGHAAEGWVDDPGMAMIRRLYPVEFNQGLSTMSNATYTSEEPWPLEFTREGLQASYLWLGDSAIASQAAWSQFRGVYSFCPLRDKKLGATVLARFGDSRTAVGGQQPIYMAVHRPSVSPVLYLGSAETWRLRAVDPALFDQFWTKTIRFVAQEHLLRQSSRGSLSIDRDKYNVGATVEVRAQRRTPTCSR